MSGTYHVEQLSDSVGESWAVADTLGEKRIPHRFDDWGPVYDHDWPTWWEMLPATAASSAPDRRHPRGPPASGS